MAVAAASKGAYYKARTRKWLKMQGYQCGDLEKVLWVGRPGKARFPIKKDQFGSDLMAMDFTEIIFVQVKGGKSCRSGMAAARREFDEHTFPPGTKRWLLMWPVRARHPQIVESTEAGVWKEL